MPVPLSEIDAVYTWVDGTRPDYLAQLGRFAQDSRDLNPERFRDAYDCLRHSLRSLERHAPWVRRVFLFTCRPHIPDWLRRDHPRLRVVHHDEVGAPAGVLPTFNSNVIESLLHLLPGLSDRFLYFNDDYFLGEDLAPGDFFAPDGRMKVFGTLCGEHFRSRVKEHQLLSLGLLEHGPILVDRAEWAAMLDAAPAETAALRTHRFRQPDDLRTDRLYRWHLLTRCRDRAVAEPCWRYLRHAVFHKIKPGPAARQRAQLDRIARRAPRFFCLNDDLGFPADPAVVAEVRAFLARMFPQPSSFELAAPS
ncbi:MAG: Stealth CR1 domain-containing protein [Opitutaceae bacterium]|nr:Stealth CR1 domain-containing protein [Opitutaceae bacterium]